MYKILIDIINR